MAALAVVVVCCASVVQAQAPAARLQLPVEQRLDVPLKVKKAPLTLVEFVGFIATAYKVPLLVETTSPVPDLKVPSGTYTARDLLNVGIRQLRGYEWKDEGGVAHLFQPALEKSPGNLLNVVVPHFKFPKTVGEFMYLFPPCVSSIIQGNGCTGGAYSGFVLPKLKQPKLPCLKFKNETARNILLQALQANGRFYVLVAFEDEHPKLKSEFPFRNWFAQSLEEYTPPRIWVQAPRKK